MVTFRHGVVKGYCGAYAAQHFLAACWKRRIILPVPPGAIEAGSL